MSTPDEATLSGAEQVRVRPTFVVVASVDDAALGRVIKLKDGELVIGRDPSAGFSVTDERLSRRHASLRREGDDFVLVDLHSSNGTWVNGTRWPIYRLQDGDSVRMGGTVFRYFNGRARERDGFREAMSHELNNAVACLRGNLDFLALAYRGGTLTRAELDEILLDCGQSLTRITDFVRNAGRDE